MIQNKELFERFFRYVKIDTQSDEDSETSPSTLKQFDLANVLSQELRDLGLEVTYDQEHCYLYGYLEGNEGTASTDGQASTEGKALKDMPALGFIAHMDTSPEASGKAVQPRIIENYQGEDSLLSTEEFPELLNHIGEDLIATDGTTLLGADDKAGLSEIMTMLSYFQQHPETAHRPIAICFTPDEETGRGTEHFDESAFAAKEAYTVDGGKLGEIEYECFNAAMAHIKIHGKNVHTGDAKGVMINALMVANQFISDLPEHDFPEKTEGYEGFFHVYHLSGDVTEAEMKMLIRDHDKEKFEARKALLTEMAEKVNTSYGGKCVVEIELKNQYRNMKEIMVDHMELVDNAIRILRELGVDAKTEPIRGGTDGAELSFRGIPCPNLCTGGYNYHSVSEYAVVQEMEKVTELLIKLCL